jgi:hypothetical protein
MARMATKEIERRVKERDVLKQVRDYLSWHHWLVVRIQQSLGCHKGLPDLLAVRDGVVLFIEVKTPKGKLSRYQEQFRDELKAHGGNYVVIRDLADVMKLNSSTNHSNRATQPEADCRGSG